EAGRSAGRYASSTPVNDSRPANSGPAAPASPRSSSPRPAPMSTTSRRDGRPSARFTRSSSSSSAPTNSGEACTLVRKCSAAVPDDALASVVANLRFRPGQVVAHPSGAHGTGVLAPAVARGARPLALHPAMTFTGRPADIERLRKGISFGLTAPEDVRPLAET